MSETPNISFADRLREPFPAADIEWRVQSSGKTPRGPWVRVLAYVNNRAIMERLDAVCGIDGWRNEFHYAPTGAVLCGLSIRVARENGTYEWITKWDGANETDIEAAKGGISNAMKRAAVQWGVGRYLYNLEEGYAIIAAEDDRTAEYLKANAQKHGDALRWRPPVLPPWALPGGSGRPDRPPTRVPDPITDPEEEKRIAQEEKGKAERMRRNHLDTLSVPGTRAHFGGHGGKRVKDVPSDDLAKIMQLLAEIDAKHVKNRRPTMYEQMVLDMAEVLEERRLAEVQQQDASAEAGGA